MCLKRQKKSTKIQLQTAGTLVASFQNKLQIFRCNSFAIFIMLSLKGYSERGLVVGFRFFPFFFMAIPNFTWERPHCRPGPGCSKLYQLQTTPVLGFSTGTAQSLQPLAQPGRYQATKMRCLQQWLGWHVSICTPAPSTGTKIKLVRSQTRLWVLLHSPVWDQYTQPQQALRQTWLSPAPMGRLSQQPQLV